jgi:glycosyltransferase involved in cell wall biosynthesis
MGGAEKFLIQLANYFTGAGIKNDIILLSNDNQLSNQLSEKIKIFEITRHNRYDSNIFKKLENHIMKGNYDKIFCINTYSYFFIRMALSRDNNIPLILSPHTTKPFSLYKYIQNFIYCRFLRINDKIIYLCKNQQDYLKKIYLYRNQNNEIIYNGVNIEYFNPDLYHIKDFIKKRCQLGINNTEKVIVQVARISNEKRQVDSINALFILHKKHNIKAHLILVGSGDKSIINCLNQQIEKLELKQYVHLVGNHLDVRSFYMISDMFTLTSSSETFPISALEALAFGLPCVLTNVGGVKEIITDEKFGRIAKAGKPNSIANEWSYVLKFSYDKKLIRDHITKNFNAQNMLEKYKRLINKD